jgi:hypothetical protein
MRELEARGEAAADGDGGEGLRRGSMAGRGWRGGRRPVGGAAAPFTTADPASAADFARRRLSSLPGLLVMGGETREGNERTCIERLGQQCRVTASRPPGAAELGDPSRALVLPSASSRQRGCRLGDDDRRFGHSGCRLGDADSGRTRPIAASKRAEFRGAPVRSRIWTPAHRRPRRCCKARSCLGPKLLGCCP